MRAAFLLLVERPAFFRRNSLHVRAENSLYFEILAVARRAAHANPELDWPDQENFTADQ